MTYTSTNAPDPGKGLTMADIVDAIKRLPRVPNTLRMNANTIRWFESLPRVSEIYTGMFGLHIVESEHMPDGCIIEGSQIGGDFLMTRIFVQTSDTEMVIMNLKDATDALSQYR